MALAQRTNVRRRVRLPIAAVVGVAALAVAMAGALAQSASPGTIAAVLLDWGCDTTIDAPRAGVAILPTGINDRGLIVGEYLRPGSESGFLRYKRGRFTIVDVPGARGTEPTRSTIAARSWDSAPAIPP
jgi:hypothetical protein